MLVPAEINQFATDSTLDAIPESFLSKDRDSYRPCGPELTRNLEFPACIGGSAN